MILKKSLAVTGLLDRNMFSKSIKFQTFRNKRMFLIHESQTNKFDKIRMNSNKQAFQNNCRNELFSNMYIFYLHRSCTWRPPVTFWHFYDQFKKGKTHTFEMCIELFNMQRRQSLQELRNLAYYCLIARYRSLSNRLQNKNAFMILNFWTNDMGTHSQKSNNKFLLKVKSPSKSAFNCNQYSVKPMFILFQFFPLWYSPAGNFHGTFSDDEGSTVISFTLKNRWN